jgi:hypothetical protein
MAPEAVELPYFGGGICNMTPNFCDDLTIPSGIIVEEESAQ